MHAQTSYMPLIHLMIKLTNRNKQKLIIYGVISFCSFLALIEAVIIYQIVSSGLNHLESKLLHDHFDPK